MRNPVSCCDIDDMHALQICRGAAPIAATLRGPIPSGLSGHPRVSNICRKRFSAAIHVDSRLGEQVAGSPSAIPSQTSVSEARNSSKVPAGLQRYFYFSSLSMKLGLALLRDTSHNCLWIQGRLRSWVSSLCDDCPPAFWCRSELLNLDSPQLP